MTRPGNVLHTRDRDYISFRREALMRVMYRDLANDKIPAVLAHSEETEQGGLFVFEGADTANLDFYREYRLYSTSVYRRGKGGAAA